MSKKIGDLLAQKSLKGCQVGRLIGEDFLEQLKGAPGFLSDSDVSALRKAIQSPEDIQAVLAHGNILRKVYFWLREAELYAVRVEREVYRGLFQTCCLAATHGKREPPAGTAAVLQGTLLRIRLLLVGWLGYKGAVEIASEYLHVDFSVLLAEDEAALVKAVDSFNECLEKVLSLYGTELKESVCPVDMAELAPIDIWRETLAEEMRENPGAARFESASNVWLQPHALPEGEWSISR